MNFGGEQLSGIAVLEDINQEMPSILRRAIAFAGRLAADGGASVYTDLEASGADPAGLRSFLNDGKQPRDRVPQNAFRLTCERDLESGVSLSIWPDGYDESNRAASDLTLQAEAGICHLIGAPDRQPLKLGGYQAAYTTGYAIYAALVSLILKTKRFGGAHTAKVDALSALTWANWKALAFGALGKEMIRQGRDAEWLVFPCKDGHAAMVFFEPHWPIICDLIGDPKLKDERIATYQGREENRDVYQPIFRNWFANHTKAEIGEAMDQRGIPNGVVATPGDLQTDPLVMHRGGLKEILLDDGRKAMRPFPPVREHKTSAAECGSTNWSKRPTPHQLPLSGFKVLDLGIITAGAGASSVLGDLGADVVKVESETYPDPFRRWAGSDDSPLFKFNNRNKRGIALDLKTDEGRAKFLDLVKDADLVVENFRRGVMERMGVGFEVLKEANPNIILVSITAQGLDGPGTQNASFGSSLEARSGMAAITGYPGDVPVVSGRNLNYPDQIVCVHGAAAAVATIIGQLQRPGAIHLDVSQRDIAVFTLGEQVIDDALEDGQALLQGNLDRDFEVNDIFLTKDGKWLAVSANKTDLPPQLTNVADAISDMNADEVIALLKDRALPFALSEKGEHVYRSASMNAGASFATSPSGEMVKGFPFQFDEDPMTIYRDSPMLGEHNDEVL